MENIHTITINEEAIINANGKKHSRHCIPVIGWPVNGGGLLRFSSIEDAAAYIGAHKTYLSQCINAEPPRNCKGYRFCHAKSVDVYIDEIINAVNHDAKRNQKNAEDAAKWREQENAKEMARKAEEARLAAIAKAEEDRRKAIEKARAKVNRLSDEVDRKYELYLAALEKHKNAAFELKELEDNANGNNNATEMEEAA